MIRFLPSNNAYVDLIKIPLSRPYGAQWISLGSFVRR